MKIKGTKYCCDPKRCVLSQKVKGYAKVDGIHVPSWDGLPSPLNHYVQDGHLQKPNPDGGLQATLEDEPGIVGFHFGEKKFDIYKKFKAVVTDQELDGTIVAAKEGYWIKIYGNYPKPVGLKGGFDE